MNIFETLCHVYQNNFLSLETSVLTTPRLGSSTRDFAFDGCFLTATKDAIRGIFFRGALSCSNPKKNWAIQNYTGWWYTYPSEK